VRDVDRDPLLAFGHQTVEQKREARLIARVPAATRILLECARLVVGREPGVVQQASDQRGFAIVVRAAGEYPEHALPTPIEKALDDRRATYFTP
jgi:hypothetical protein